MKTIYILRPAVAMVELIFSIVIIGIVLMSAPMVISTANKSGFLSLQQEAISAAASELNMILTYPWDEGNTDESLASPILGTAGAGDLNEAVITGNATGRRWGTDLRSKRRFITALGTRVPATIFANLGREGDDNNTNDDIDDFNAIVSTLNNIQATATQTGDYVDNTISIATTVVYISDAPTNNSYRGMADTINFDITTNSVSGAISTNIKRVSVQLTTANTKANIILHAFACNIGSYELEER